MCHQDNTNANWVTKVTWVHSQFLWTIIFKEIFEHLCISCKNLNKIYKLYRLLKLHLFTVYPITVKGKILMRAEFHYSKTEAFFFFNSHRFIFSITRKSMLESKWCIQRSIHTKGQFVTYTVIKMSDILTLQLTNSSRSVQFSNKAQKGLCILVTLVFFPTEFNRISRYEQICDFIKSCSPELLEALHWFFFNAISLP